MDIDVINALKNLCNACENISKSSFFNNIEYSLKDLVKYDIINFINIISIENDDVRIADFIHRYLDGKQIEKIELSSPITSLSFPLFVFFDVNNNTETSIIVKHLFEVIGKYYLFNNTEKREIDRNSYINYIVEMNNYIDKVKNENSMLEKSKKSLGKQVNLQNSEKQNEDTLEVAYEQNLDELLDEFNSLIGLETVKSEVRKRINQIRVDKRRKKVGYRTSSISLHLVFTGNPGTGKTTVARKLAAIYKELGVISKGQLIEVDRSKLVGGYVGSTAIKTQEVIDKALGGILFIDEAYTLTYGKGESDFGQEAIDTLLKAMEDNRDDFVVIVAGYNDEMNEFIKSNPGLESRFNKYIEFEDYTANELVEIFKLICKNDEKHIHEECYEYLTNYFKELVVNKPSNFANGRIVRNYYEKVIESLNERLVVSLDEISDEELQVIRLIDLQKTF